MASLFCFVFCCKAIGLFADVTRLGRPNVAALFVFAFDRFVNFLSVDRDVLGRVDSKADFVSAYIDNSDHGARKDRRHG